MCEPWNNKLESSCTIYLMVNSPLQVLKSSQQPKSMNESCSVSVLTRMLSVLMSLWKTPWSMQCLAASTAWRINPRATGSSRNPPLRRENLAKVSHGCGYSIIRMNCSGWSNQSNMCTMCGLFGGLRISRFTATSVTRGLVDPGWRIVFDKRSAVTFHFYIETAESTSLRPLQFGILVLFFHYKLYHQILGLFLDFQCGRRLLDPNTC